MVPCPALLSYLADHLSLQRRLARHQSLDPVSVANWIGWDQRTAGQEILDSINKYEHSQKRPLLSALVVSSTNGFPSTGFFREAARRGLYRASKDNEYVGRIRFLLKEVQRIYDIHRPTGG